MVKRMSYINHPNQLYETCLIDKHARRSFFEELESRVKKPIQHVYTYDFIIKTFMYFLKQKSDVFVIFKNFKTLVEKESGYVIKALRSNKGDEFSKEFNKFCEKKKKICLT
ncbi:hypothetical protein CR513_56983, partial [Mucuna pruriens]